MHPPILRAVSESGEAWDDPSEDLLFELLADVDHGKADFLIVERVSDPSGQTYAQSLRRDDGRYAVEWRDGSLERHYTTVAADMREAHALLTGWAFEIEGWDRGRAWSRLDQSG
jgi:hypothetical protein